VTGTKQGGVCKGRSHDFHSEDGTRELSLYLDFDITTENLFIRH